MKRRTMLAGAAALAVARPAGAAEPTQIVFWHSMTAALADEVTRICNDFNASQPTVAIKPIYKGGYADTLTAAIAAWRAGQAPHVVQMFEVGTGSMLAAGPAVKQVWQLIAETGVAIDPQAYIPAVRGYYSLADGRLAAMPFNSSTAMMWYNKDAFVRAGLDPEAPPTTWQDIVVAARAIKEKNAATVAMTTSWPAWIQFEEYSAIHDIPFATKGDGFEGLDAELKVNSPAHVKHLQRLLDMAKEGTFRYGGRDTAADPLLLSGDAAIAFNSSGERGDLIKSAKFKWGEAFLPYDPEVNPQPINSIIGGASLWTMTAPSRTPAEYKAVAEFLKFIGTPEQAALWHQHTGYVPVTTAGYELSKSQGLYEKNPGADLPIRQLTRGHVTANSRGFRLGRMPEIRNIIQEEMENALQGKQGAQQALDTAVTRGNKVLRDFEKSVRT